MGGLTCSPSPSVQPLRDGVGESTLWAGGWLGDGWVAGWRLSGAQWVMAGWVTAQWGSVGLSGAQSWAQWVMAG